MVFTLNSRIDRGWERGGLNEQGQRGSEKFIKSNKGGGGGWNKRGDRIFIIFTIKIWLFVTKSACKRVLRTFGRENC